jgi:hypothetical protein
MTVLLSVSRPEVGGSQQLSPAAARTKVCRLFGVDAFGAVGGGDSSATP